MAVKGLMRRNEVFCLYNLAREANSLGVIVEIGSYQGLSTIALAKGSLKGHSIPVYAVDPHDYADPEGGITFCSRDNVAFLKNILFANVADIIRPINLKSWQVAIGWEQPIGLLWIDGNHEYEAVRKDFDVWEKFVVPGGHIAFHDSSDSGGGPYRVVQEILTEAGFELIRRVEKVSVLRKI
jgi:hypothetical protein